MDRSRSASTSRRDPLSALTTSGQASLFHALQHPQAAAAYVTAALADGDSAVFLVALRNVTDAQGMKTVAHKAQRNRHNRYRMLSEQGTPQRGSLTALRDALNVR